MIAAKRIFFPPESKQPYIFNSKAELEEAVRSGIGPTDGKRRPLLRLDLPDLDFWIGRPIAHGRPSIKTFVIDDETVARPISSWVANSSDSISQPDSQTLVGERQGAGTDILMKIFGNKIFDFPKPPGLLREFVSSSVVSGDIVLDFFAGSGTTAHAVLALNAVDEGDRRFIMVSNTEATKEEPDKNLCRDVCAERIRRVIAGYGDVEGLGGDFAYLKTRRVDEEDVVYDVDPAALWILIQLRQGRDLMPFDPGAPIQIALPLADDENADSVVYVPQVTDAALAALAALEGSAVVFAHAPGLLDSVIRPGLVVEIVPGRLLAEFRRNVVGL